MATALIQGLVSNGVKAESICASDPSQEQLEKLHASCPIRITTDNSMAVRDADVVIMAVKPQVMEKVLVPLQGHITKDTLVLSIAAGVTLSNLANMCQDNQAIVRCMPNTPALVKIGASALFANTHTSTAQQALAESILSAVGKVCWLKKEEEMDAVTALSGSGPAYFFLMIEAMINSGKALGLESNTAQELAIQTALGAATLAASSDVDVAELRRRVTSPGGTTEAALKQFEADDFRDVVSRALNSAARRSKELSLPSE